ncbi:S1 family peptidase [Williamsia muralis]|uniref:S1 family peptidase n=1 Tax=Williamsia marianensis TaxID=85044 RepID=UPI000DE75E93|nr:serine protease [Williamsia marianensis]PVY32284.1 trypsin-like peptidase [Williamsia marianensis]
MEFDPLNACGVIACQTADGAEHITGSCFLFRSDSFVLTAAHCIPDDAHDLVVILPRLDRRLRVQEVITHSTADIAALICDASDERRPDGSPAIAFSDGVDDVALGQEWYAYGFPALTGPDVSPTMPARLYKPYFQRFFDYVSPNGRAYIAAELSVPAPGGLSGSPLFRPNALSMVSGIVTANYESYAITDSVEEIDEDGKVLRIEGRKIVTIGLALVLVGVADFLNDVTPVEAPGGRWGLTGKK